VINALGINGIEKVKLEDAIYFPFYDNTFTKEYIKSKGDIIKVKNPKIKYGAHEIFKSDAVYSDMDEQYYAKKDTKHSNFLNDYIPSNKVVFSNYMNSYIPGKDSVEVIVDISLVGLITTDYYHINDPMDLYFKHTDGKFYLKGMEDVIKREEKYNGEN